MVDQKIVTSAVTCLGVTFGLLVVLFLLTFGAVGPLQYAVTIGTFSKSVSSDKYYTAGRFFIGPFQSFVEFPEYQVNIEFSNFSTATSPALSTRTSEGLSLSVAVSFQYKLQPEKLKELYTMSTTLYQDTYVRIAKEVIMAVAGNYTAQSYWLSRYEIGVDMREQLDASLKEMYANVSGLQILSIVLPESYEEQIVETQVQTQQTLINQYIQEATLILSNITIANSTYQQKILEVNAGASANATITNQNAIGMQQLLVLQAENNVYSQLTGQSSSDNSDTDLGLSNDELEEYIYYNSLQSKDNELLVGVNNAYVVVNNDKQGSQTSETNAYAKSRSLSQQYLGI